MAFDEGQVPISTLKFYRNTEWNAILRSSLCLFSPFTATVQHTLRRMMQSVPEAKKTEEKGGCCCSFEQEF